MEMPVLCSKCNEWVELNDCRESNLARYTTHKLICKSCYNVDQEVFELKEEIDDIEYMFETNDETLKGDRRGWRKLMKEKKARIDELGYDYEDLI